MSPNAGGGGSCGVSANEYMQLYTGAPHTKSPQLICVQMFNDDVYIALLLGYPLHGETVSRGANTPIQQKCSVSARNAPVDMYRTVGPICLCQQKIQKL
jgi:hypothetical protein